MALENAARTGEQLPIARQAYLSGILLGDTMVPILGTVIWKFKNLSCAMLQTAWPEDPDFESRKFQEDAEIH